MMDSSNMDCCCQEKERTSKVVVIGAGLVGATYAYTLLLKGLVSEIVLIDVDQKRVWGEMMDLNHGMSFVKPTSVRLGDYKDCADADLIVISAGAAQKEGETRLDLVHKNVKIFETIVSQIVASGSRAVLLVATNPVDVLTYVTYKLSGYPKARVIGSGTALDTARFRYLLSHHCRIDPTNVHAYILGEHGDSEVPIWSLANIAGLRFTEYCPVCGRDCDPLRREDIFTEVKEAAYKIIDAKGATYYAIGLVLAHITESILRNQFSVLTVSTVLDGEYGLRDLCLSLPTVLSRAGAVRKIKLKISPEEERLLIRSGRVIREVIDEIGY